MLAGCQHPTPLVVGWARVDVLEALHPARAMEADLLQRAQELAAQRARLLGQTRPALPPPEMVEQAPAPAALAEPPPSPHFNWQTESFHDALLGARTRMLTHQQQQDTTDFLRQREDRYDKELAEGAAKLDSDYATQIKQIEAEQAQPLQRAMMSFDLAQFNVTTYPTSGDSQAKLETARKAVQHIQAELKSAKGDAAAALATAKRQQQIQLTAEMQQDVALKKGKLQADYADQYRQLGADLAGQLTPTPAPPQAAPLDYTPFTSPPQSLDLSALLAQARASAERMSGERRRAAQEIDDTIAELVVQRQQLHARIATETRAAVEAVAAQHGYRVRFTAGAGADITAAARLWLQGYWTGR